MIDEFKEFSTNAILKIGNEEVLQQESNYIVENYFTFIRATDTSAKIKVDGEIILLCPGNIMTLVPRQHVTFFEGNGLVIYQFNREFYCIKDHDKEVSCMGILFFGNDFTPIVKLTEEELIKFEMLHTTLVEEIKTQDNVQAEMLRMLLKQFIIRTTRLVKQQKDLIQHDSSKMELLRQFNILVEEHFKNEHQVNFYASLLFKSPKTLSNNFNIYNTSPLKIIQKRIILEAKRLFSYSDKTQKEVAYELGFEDSSHFSRFFKNKAGISASEFKKARKGNIVNS